MPLSVFNFFVDKVSRSIHGSTGCHDSRRVVLHKSRLVLQSPISSIQDPQNNQDR
uniref:Uncharacterized protein n=1 Tax=Arion vulgaris TaxID=1028688 RepID=A0A0B7B191_9EUPU